MYPLLYKYLMLHDEVCIAGVGRFYKERTPATHDFSNKIFLPPFHAVILNEEQVKADKKFFSFLSKEQGINEVEAIRQYHDFGYQLHHHLQQYNYAELPGLGTISRNEDGLLQFQQEALINNYFAATPADRIVRADAEHTIRVGETYTTNTQMQVALEDYEVTPAGRRWWIWALVLALMAMAAIAYYFIANGDLRI